MCLWIAICDLNNLTPTWTCNVFMKAFSRLSFISLKSSSFSFRTKISHSREDDNRPMCYVCVSWHRHRHTHITHTQRLSWYQFFLICIPLETLLLIEFDCIEFEWWNSQTENRIETFLWLTRSNAWFCLSNIELNWTHTCLRFSWFSLGLRPSLMLVTETSEWIAPHIGKFKIVDQCHFPKQSKPYHGTEWIFIKNV